MKKLFVLITCLFYRYYNKGSTRSIAYESALMAVSLIVFLNIAAIVALTNGDFSWLANIELRYGSFIKYLSGIFLILPQYLLFRFTLKREEVIRTKIDKKRIKIYNWLLVLYIIVSMLIIFIGVTVKK